MSTQLWESGDVCSLGVCLCSSCILIKHLRRSRCKSVHELLPESSENVRTGQTSMRELPVRSSESHHIHCCESQSRVLTDACRCFSCILPRQGSEACAGEIARRRLLRKAQGKIWIAEEEHVRYQRCSQQLGTRLARASRKLGLRAGAQFKKLASAGKEPIFRSDTW